MPLYHRLKTLPFFRPTPAPLLPSLRSGTCTVKLLTAVPVSPHYTLYLPTPPTLPYLPTPCAPEDTCHRGAAGHVHLCRPSAVALIHGA